MANNINSLSAILPSIHYYINASTVILLQFTYYIIIYKHIMVWYEYLISPGEAFSHEATLQGTQNSTDTSTVE